MTSNMQITVLDVKGKDITLIVDPEDLVKDVKEKIEAQMNIPPYLQKLTFCGEVLKYKKTLQFYKIGTGATLQFSPNTLLPGNQLDLKYEEIGKPGIDWSSLAARGKAKVDAEIERRKEQYNSILEVKNGVEQKANDLIKDMRIDRVGLKSVDENLRIKYQKMASLSDDIEKLQQAMNRKQLEICETEKEQESLVDKREEIQVSLAEKHSRLDVFKTDMKNLDEDMKQVLASDEELNAKGKDELKKASDFMKDFLLESISAKKSLLECPVCYETAFPPIHKCPKEHLICSKCLPKMDQKCPTCRIDILKSTDNIFRLAEENYLELQKLRSKLANLSCGIGH